MLSAKARSNLFFDVSSSARPELDHLLQQQLPPLHLKVDNIPDQALGHSVHLKLPYKPVISELEQTRVI